MVHAFTTVVLAVLLQFGAPCYGITNGHAKVQDVDRGGVITYFTVNYDGMADRIATLRRPKSETVISFNALVCNGHIDVMRWWYGSSGETKTGK